MPQTPYLMFGFDVDSSNPAAPAIIADVEAAFPFQTDIIPLGVANMYTLHVPPSQSFARFSKLSVYLEGKDTEHGNVLRWVVQLCHSDEFAEG